MQNKQSEILRCVNSLRESNNDLAYQAAIELCILDIRISGYRNFLLWDSTDIADIFSRTAIEVVQAIVDEVNLKNEAMMPSKKETHWSEQEKLNTLEEAKKLALASSELFRIHKSYVSIREYVKFKFSNAIL